MILFIIKKKGKDKRMQGEGAGSSEQGLICKLLKNDSDFSSLKRH